MNIGNRIKQRRIELGMSQQELASAMGYTSKSTINKIELGKNDVSQSKVVKFSKVLDTTPSYLMGWYLDNDNNSKEIRENKTMTKKTIDECVDIARKLNTMNEQEICLVYDMLLDQQRTAFETSLFYQIYENKHKELNRMDARKLIDTYISDYYEDEHRETIYEYILTRIKRR